MVKKDVQSENSEMLIISAAIEADINELNSPEDKHIFLKH